MHDDQGRPIAGQRSAVGPDEDPRQTAYRLRRAAWKEHDERRQFQPAALLPTAEPRLRWWAADLGDPWGQAGGPCPAGGSAVYVNSQTATLQDARTVCGATKASNSQALLT